MRGLAVALALLAAGPLLSACGFTPLYASSTGVGPNLSSIQVVTPQGRAGHLLAEALADQLATRYGDTPRFTLNLALDERRYARGLQPEEIATWYEQYERVHYSLVDAATGKTVTAGVVPVSVSYDAVRDPYAGIVQQQNGEERAANEAAIRIRLELSRFFAEQGVP